MSMVDPEFSEIFTALAVTHGFTGSPHIDKQNITPFFGMSIGSFREGEGKFFFPFLFTVIMLAFSDVFQKIK
jgi:hypothetical protein